MAGVLELTTIDRLELIIPATMSPMQQTPTTKKWDLQEINGFQGWLRGFYLGTEVTTTIVVNVGAVTKD
jgi:hypothetical protein